MSDENLGRSEIYSREQVEKNLTLLNKKIDKQLTDYSINPNEIKKQLDNNIKCVFV